MRFSRPANGEQPLCHAPSRGRDLQQPILAGTDFLQENMSSKRPRQVEREEAEVEADSTDESHSKRVRWRKNGAPNPATDSDSEIDELAESTESADESQKSCLALHCYGCGMRLALVLTRRS